MISVPKNERRSVVLPIPPGHFLEEPLHASVTLGMKGRSMWKGHRRTPSPTLKLPLPTRESSSTKDGSRRRAPRRSTRRIFAIATIVCSSAMWLWVSLQYGTSSPVSVKQRKSTQISEAFKDRGLCAPLLPNAVKHDAPWLVGVHVDRSPMVLSRHDLRGNKRHRELPHLYFIQVVEATLRAISLTEPAAKVNVAVFTEGRWGSIVDDTGLPFTWDIPAQICEELGLSCSQDLLFIDEKHETPDALACLASADVMIGSEDKFSRAAAAISSNVKVLTDDWDLDEDAPMVTLNPAATVAGLPDASREALQQVVRDWHERGQSREHA